MGTLPAYFNGILAVLLLTCFVKILTTLNLLRFGFGLQGNSFGIVIIAASLALSLLVMSPQIEKSGGMDSLLSSTSSNTNSDLALEKNFRPFLEKHTQAELRERFEKLATRLKGQSTANSVNDSKSEKVNAENQAANSQKSPQQITEATAFSVLIAAFIVSEIKSAFQLGLMLLIPLLVIDLLVTNVLMALGVTQLPGAVVSLPCKLLLFFAVDGWALLSEKLVTSYLL